MKPGRCFPTTDGYSDMIIGQEKSLQPFLKALADPTRERIVLLLRNYELSVNEICNVLGMGQSRVSRHLKILLDADVLDCRREGLSAYYSLVSGGRGLQCLTALFPFMYQESIEADRRRAEAMLVQRGERTREFFNDIAPRWDDLKKKIFGDFDSNAFIADLLHDIDCKTIVDLGCGTGDLINTIIERNLFSGDIIGVDNSPAMIELASRRFSESRKKPELRIGSIEHLPLRDNEADCALLNCVLHHSPNPRETLCEINRALKPGTTLVLVDFDRHDMAGFSKDYGDLWLGFDKKSLCRWLHAGGFEVRRYDAVSIGSNMALHILLSEKMRGLHGIEATA